MRYLKALDIPIIILLVILSALPLFISSKSASYVLVTTDEGSYLFPLLENMERSFSGPVGKTVIKVEEGKVRIISSDCPEKTCMHSYIDRAPSALICLPNHISVTIKGESDGTDAVSY